MNENFLLGSAIFISLACLSQCFHVQPTACNVSLTDRCPASLYYVPETPKTLEETASLFHISSNLVNRTAEGFVISINCSCFPEHDEFTWHTDYTVQPGDTWMSISAKFGSFVMEKPDKTLIVSQNITLDVLCGCSGRTQLMSYKVQYGDTLYTICSQFNTSMDKTARLNKLENPNLVHAGDILFIPGPDCKPLPWTTRVRIAFDVAKGLEYIHMHTKPYYVHRDVKTSNILLDSHFRGKVADFGLVKLFEHSTEIGTAASRIVGTIGYLTPECDLPPYVRDGFVTGKSDVYAFGVVLMELITGQTALSRDAGPGNADYCEHRSLVDHMLSILQNNDPWTKLSQCIDQNLLHYDKESLLQMALLSKECVDEDWNRRPDMCKVVLCLSHILICSKKWQKKSKQFLKQ